MNPSSTPQSYLDQGSTAPVKAVPEVNRAVESEDEALVRRMAAGDDVALGALYDRWHAVVHGVVSRLLRQPDDVDDVVEETFWQAWRQAARFDRTRGAVQTWLLTIARSRALDRVRALRRRREEPLVGDDGEVVVQQAAEGDPGLDAEASERRRIVVAALAGLPAEQRQALELGYFGGLSQTEIAERTGQPLGTVKTRMRLAMQKLRGQLQVLGSEGMTHEQARESLEALALDALDASERDAVMAHLATCAICQSELAALENTANELAYAATPLPMSPPQRDRIRARLMARAAADRESRDPIAAMAPPLRVEPTRAPAPSDVVPVRQSAPARRAFGPAAWMAMAASIVAIVGVGAFMKASGERDALREALVSARAANGAQLAALDSLRTVVASRNQMLANLTGPQVAVMKLASTAQAAPSGMMFWDQRHDAWTFVAHQVPMPKAGRTYQLWLVTPTAKISAGTFAPTPDGEVMMQATYALPKDSLAAVAVTDEPMGGSPEPTTQPFLVASR